MKFLCDRCKTRYSIGDDRVRGKILKIRCKNCANVITVREGMTDEGAATEEPAAPNGRAARPTTTAPKPAHTAVVNGTKPPAALDEEWYVSIDGEQSGPYSLTEAQKWIGARPLDAELHCWSEGFDDWLPVDKVSHFRGLRRKPAAVGAPPPTPRANVRPAPVEEEPKPLFAATMASLERGIAEQPHRVGSPAPGLDGRPIVRATPAGGVPVPRGGPNGSNGAPAPVATKGNGAGSAPVAAPVTAKAATGPTQIPKAGAKSGPAPVLPKPGPGTGPSPVALPMPTPRLQTQPGHTPAPAPAPLGVPGFDVTSDLDSPDSATAVGGVPFPDERSVAPLAAKSAFPLPAPLPTLNPFGPQAPLFPPSPPEPDDDGGLDIGEVSRVVNLADIMRPPAKKNQTSPVRRMTGPNPNLGRTGAAPKLDPASLHTTPMHGTGALLTAPATETPLLTPDAMADAQQLEPLPPPPPVQQRRSLVMLLLVAVVLLGGVGAVVAFVLTNNSETVQQLGLGPDQADQIDTTRPADQIRHNPLIPQIGSNGSAATIPHSNPNTNPIHKLNPIGPLVGPGSNGKVESDPLSPTSPLKPDEVEDMSAKQATGATRCWERALRKQPYLQKDIKKVSVTVTVDAPGTVSNVQIAGMPTEDGGLGVCLQAFIRAWRFRQSSSGITAKFSMVFQNG